MKHVFLLALVLTLVSCSSPFTKKSSSNDKEMLAREYVRYRLEHGEFELFVDQTTKLVSTMMQSLYKTQLKRSLTDTELKGLTHAVQKTVEKVFPKELLASASIQTMSDNFNEDELKEILTFFKTETGQKVLEKQVQMTKQTEEIIGRMMKDKTDEIKQILTEELKKEFSIEKPKE